MIVHTENPRGQQNTSETNKLLQQSCKNQVSCFLFNKNNWNLNKKHNINCTAPPLSGLSLNHVMPLHPWSSLPLQVHPWLSHHTEEPAQEPTLVCPRAEPTSCLNAQVQDQSRVPSLWRYNLVPACPSHSLTSGQCFSIEILTLPHAVGAKDSFPSSSVQLSKPRVLLNLKEQKRAVKTPEKIPQGPPDRGVKLEPSGNNW